MKKTGLDWAIKILILSVALSIVFGVLSQSIFPILPAFLSVFVIFFFILLSSLFDMIGVAFTAFDIQKLEKHKTKPIYKTANKLCQNSDKISSFCADVVGDICGILSGAGGVSLVLNLNLQNQNISFFITCFTSSVIAGLTIFLKAIMKPYAINNAETIVLKTAKVLTNPVLSLFRKKQK